MMANIMGSMVVGTKTRLVRRRDAGTPTNIQHHTIHSHYLSKWLNVKYLRGYTLYAYVSWEVASCATEYSADGFLHQLSTFSNLSKKKAFLTHSKPNDKRVIAYYTDVISRQNVKNIGEITSVFGSYYKWNLAWVS